MQPAANVLRVAFVPSAWRRNLKAGSLLAFVAFLYALRWMRADDVAQSYSDFWGLDPPRLPQFYWLGLDTWLGLATLIRLVALRLRRDPHLCIGEDEIRTTFTQSYTRRVDRSRVTEVRFDPKRGTIRFEVPDGLVLTVDAKLIDLRSVGESAASFADLCARTLDVPLVEVGAFGRVRPGQGETGSQAA